MAKAPRILLVNPPIYDFAAYDFWVKPYGLLSVAGYLRGKAEFALFDYLDRLHPFYSSRKGFENDEWGRDKFYFEKIPSPCCFKDIPRHFRRFGMPRTIFRDFLGRHTHSSLRYEGQADCDFVLVNTVMTYWYPGVQEVIEDIRQLVPKAKIILGGNYVTLCRGHAEKLGADFLVEGANLAPLWDYVGLKPDMNQPGLWEAYGKLTVGVLKLSDGCPFECTYCLVPRVYGKFQARPLERSLAELELLSKLGAKNIAFYDDALLFDAKNVLVSFLSEILKRDIKVNFHSPNAINARFVTKEIAELMIRAGFKTFYLGFESTSREWQQQTGSKVFSEELAEAVANLKSALRLNSGQAGAESNNITAYQILGHPKTDVSDLEESMRFVNRLGIRGMLADFSPVPDTPDGELCRKWVDMDEPLLHNKTAFPIILLGFDESNRLKDLQRQLNRSLIHPNNRRQE